MTEPLSTLAAQGAVAPITPERLAEVRERFDAIMRSEPDSLTGHVKGMLALIDRLSAPSPEALPASGVEAVIDGLDNLARRMPVSSDMLLISEAIGLIQSLAASAETVRRRAKYLLNRLEGGDPLGIGEVDTILRMAAALPPLADATNNPVPLTLSDAGSDAEGRG